MVAADGSGMSRKEEGCSDKLHRTNITMLPQHATHAARSIHSVVSFPQSIAAADQAEMEQWWAMHRFPANVLTRLLQQNPAITDMQDLGEVDDQAPVETVVHQPAAQILLEEGNGASLINCNKATVIAQSG